MWFWNCEYRDKIYHIEARSHKEGLCGEPKSALHFRLSVVPSEKRCPLCVTLDQLTNQEEDANVDSISLP